MPYCTVSQLLRTVLERHRVSQGYELLRRFVGEQKPEPAKPKVSHKEQLASLFEM